MILSVVFLFNRLTVCFFISTGWRGKDRKDDTSILSLLRVQHSSKNVQELSAARNRSRMRCPSPRLMCAPWESKNNVRSTSRLDNSLIVVLLSSRRSRRLSIDSIDARYKSSFLLTATKNEKGGGLWRATEKDKNCARYSLSVKRLRYSYRTSGDLFLLDKYLTIHHSSKLSLLCNRLTDNLYLLTAY